jgi:hypothetical protein
MNLDSNELLFLYIFLQYKFNYDYIKNRLNKFKFYLSNTNLIPDITKIKVLKNNSIKEHNFIPIGYIKKYKFIWYKNMNNIFKKHFINYEFNNIHIKDNLVKYLFNSEVILLSRFRYIIPYIISFTNSNYNVVEFIDSNDNILYALVDTNIEKDCYYENRFMNILNHI